MKHTLYLFVAVFVLMSSNLSAQKIGRVLQQLSTKNFQKLYLHTDREFYFKKDTLWFAAYLLNARNHKLSNENSTIYTDLINTKGEIVKTELFPLESGKGRGYISFDNRKLNAGNYLLRAYTKNLEQLGSEVFFTKTIKISESKNTFGFDSMEDISADSIKTTIDFYPEGGFILADKINQIAFKVNNLQNKGFDLTGEIVNSHGETVANFGNIYKGMGRFYLIPKNNEKYTVKINSSKTIEAKFPEIKSNGAKIMIALQQKKFINLNIVVSDDPKNNDFFIAAFHRGQGLFFSKIEKSNIEKTIQFKTKTFKTGINRLVLLNNFFEPVSERLIFVDKNDVVNLSVTTDKSNFSTREKVKVSVAGLKNKSARLSVAVVNNNALNANGISQNIKSYLLIDSELNGSINQPNQFFKNGEKLSSKAKLNLLMLTQGWKNYIWNSLNSKQFTLDYLNSTGLTISGNVSRLNQKKLISNASVSLGIFKKENPQLLFTNSDLNGYFEFRNVVFYDTALLFIQAKNQKNKPYTHVDLIKSWNKFPHVTVANIRQTKQNFGVPVAMYRQHYLNELALNEFYPDRDSKLIKEIDIIGNKPEEKNEHTQIYSTPDHSIKLKSSDYNYSDIFSFLTGRFPGVQVSGKSITIRGPSSLLGNNEPLFLVDGVPANKSMIETMSLFDVDK